MCEKVNVEKTFDMDNMTMAEKISLAADLIRAAKTQMMDAHELIAVYNKRQDEILHQIETSYHNVSDGYALYKELRELRRKRRVVKNVIFTASGIKQNGMDIGKVDYELQKLVKIYHISQEVYDKQVDYGNYDQLGKVTWSEAKEFIDQQEAVTG